MKEPKPIPAGDPVPFALSDVDDAVWPIITSDGRKFEVTYEATDGTIIGANQGRRFLASRSNGARRHVGLDLFCSHRDVVVACEAGRITAFYGFYTTSAGELSYALFIEHEDFAVNYGEVKGDAQTEFGWRIGDTVAAGQRIARVSTTNMIHFETYVRGTARNERWMTGGSRPSRLLNPTRYLLSLAAKAQGTSLPPLGGGETPAAGERTGSGGFAGLVAAYARADIAFPNLKAVTLAQWILESARGESALAREHHNYGGLKWRSEMEGLATKVSYEAHDGREDYCAFASEEAFIQGYWRFLERDPYKGWKDRAADEEAFFNFIGPIYCPNAGYVEKVFNLRPEARKLLADAGSESAGGLGLAPGESDRPSRAELESREATRGAAGAAATGAGELWIPFARRNEGGEMRTQGRYRRSYPEGAIVHFTAGRDNPLNDISSGIRNGYAYLTVAPNGTVYQNHPLDRWGYHAGPSSWPALGGGVSQYLVGIEICASGKLRRIDDNHYRPWYNEASYLGPLGRTPRPEDDLRADQVRHVHAEANRVEGWYEKYTDAQETALKALLKWLHDNKPGTFSYDLVLGHDEVSPGRKNDPGGALSVTMPAFRTWLKANA